MGRAAGKRIPEVAVDARFLSTGLGTYTANILKNLDREKVRIRALTRSEHADALRPLCDSFRIVDADMYSISEQFAVARAASGCDLFHAIHYNVPVMHAGKMLVTIHDLTHLLDKSLKRDFRRIFYAHPMLKLASSRAAHIITVSHYSKRNLVELLGVSEDKVSVIPNGVSDEFYPESQASARGAIREVLGFDGPYVVYIGNLKGHKNVDGLLRAFKSLVGNNGFDHKLVIAGDDKSGRPALMRLATQLGLDDQVVFLGRVDQQHLRRLYCGATVAVLPSFEEGFGLTVLEAMACGTPVACSRIASLPEVGGDAVEYFDPASDESIAASIQRLLDSGELRADLALRGIEQAKRFSWEASGRAHRALYQALTS